MINLLIVIFVAYVAIGVFLYINQRSFLYFPSQVVEHNYQKMLFQNEGESISVVVVNPGKDRALLYFGGNGEAVAAGAPVFEEMLAEYTTYMVDYRGYGQSSGEPTQRAIFSDALHIFDEIEPKHSSMNLFGRSLGSGVAVFVASKRTVSKLALITPYDSIQSVAQGRFPLYPMSILFKDKYDSISRVSDIKADTIVLIASDDSVVPPKHAHRLVAAFPKAQIKSIVIDGAEHNNIAYTIEYHEALTEFFR